MFLGHHRELILQVLWCPCFSYSPHTITDNRYTLSSLLSVRG
nr:MAG TPA_asm: hypothetical protein [Inoviridae sp.]